VSIYLKLDRNRSKSGFRGQGAQKFTFGIMCQVLDIFGQLGPSGASHGIVCGRPAVLYVGSLPTECGRQARSDATTMLG
jgi:hypothetical protein